MGLQAPQEIFAADFRTNSATQENRLGARGTTIDGRIYRYAEAAGTALVAGNLNVSATPASNHNNIAVTAVAVGQNQVPVTLGATAAAANLYAEGYLNVTDLVGEGILYLVEGHAAIASSGAGSIRLSEPIAVALDATSQVTLIQNKFKDILISVTDQADNPVGVSNVAITADQFGFVQTGGPCSVFGDEVVAVGDNVTIGDTTAGQVSVVNADSEPLVGICMEASVAGEYTVIDLKLES